MRLLAWLGWDSLPFADRAHSWLELTAMIFVGLSFVTGLLAILYGNRAKTLLERMQPPHALTEEQRAAIAEKAKGSAGTELVIESIVGDVEAKNLSDDITAALRSVDWTVLQSTPYFIQRPDQPLVVFVPDPERPSAAAEALILGLQAVGLRVEGKGGLDPQSRAFLLRIGERAR